MSLHDPQDDLPALSLGLAIFVLAIWAWSKLTGRAL